MSASDRQAWCFYEVTLQKKLAAQHLRAWLGYSHTDDKLHTPSRLTTICITLPRSVPIEASMTNPLRTKRLFPPYKQLQPAQVMPALRQVLKQNRATLKQCLKATEHTWENLMAPLAQMDQDIHQVWAPVSHLVAVCHSQAWQRVHDQALGLLTDYSTALMHHQGLYEAMRSIRHSNAYRQLSTARQAVLNHALRDFELAGVHLPKAAKQQVKNLEHKLSKASSTFSKQLLAATEAWSLHLPDASRLAGLSDTALASARQAAKGHRQAAYRLTLQMPCYLAVMRDAKDRKLRQSMYTAYHTRASDQGPMRRHNNATVMVDTLKNRQRLAKQLGYTHYADLALCTRMASSSAQVERFLRQLLRRAKPKAKRDLKALQQFAKTHLDLKTLQAWDLSYVAERYREQHFDLSQDAIRAYFPEPHVIAGLFDVVKRLYGFRITPYRGAQRCHPLVKVYQLKHRNNCKGYLVFDLYARQGKRGGAWMNECQQRYKDKRGVHLPIAHVVANFEPPTGPKPACLTHDDVETLFHEMGHALHHVLTEVDEADVSGINGVPWDAVECPSQWMENWCWDPKVLKRLSSHIDTGKSIPKSLVDQLLATRTFMSGMHVLRQCELALFDWLIHSNPKITSKRAIRACLAEIREQTMLLPVPKFNRFENSFGHIFAGGYAAGYYSYLWAEVLSADAFAAFQETGGLNRRMGLHFLKSLLSQGGQTPFMQLYKNFRGRPPKLDALLKQYGMEKAR